ncbi:MAG: M48 family metallopeptidase [Methanolobus sp.]|uniref:M48 family metallopeptidase n=1 Tax=Methanolobus sp. TaxID=1874737 RepID=UPI002730B05F|nr:M48 family metallopeptidase [Methanolobus sp.]MDP2216711.1 M48 family metallopeptidase [Methanolobus sp.]
MEHQVIIKDAVICYEVIRRKVKTPRLEFKKGRLKLIVPKDYSGHEKIIHRHRRWIYNRHSWLREMRAGAEEIQLTERPDENLRMLVKSMVSDISKELGVVPQAVHFRMMRTKWGSCSSKGNLNFNTHIRYLPEELIEYIVFHEMVHLIELNHSPAFHTHIKARFSDHRDYDRKLSSYWLLIHNQVNSVSPCAAQ